MQERPQRLHLQTIAEKIEMLFVKTFGARRQGMVDPRQGRSGMTVSEKRANENLLKRTAGR